MRFPWIVEDKLSAQAQDNYRIRFSRTPWDRSVRENVWRRHQHQDNQAKSGWQPGEERRRLLHFRDKYELIGDAFCLSEVYLFLHIKAPQAELAKYVDKVKWTEYGDLRLTLEMLNESAGYASMNMRIFNKQVSEVTLNRPWVLLNTGIRKVLPAGNPTRIAMEDLRSFCPAQVELGCGPSVEAGIPPLNYFHKLFSLHKDGRFVFKAEDDTFLEVLEDPEAWYKRAVHMQRQCLMAEPTPFYHHLKALHNQGHIVGPVLTNNFDGLPLSVGLEEHPLRQYDDKGVYPPIEFHPQARSLFVIGSHADRRKCQAHARAQGLRIVYIDPEGYDTDQGFCHYPLESPQDEDYIVNARACELRL